MSYKDVLKDLTNIYTLFMSKIRFFKERFKNNNGKKIAPINRGKLKGKKTQLN